MFSYCPKCKHSIFDHSEDASCDMKGCTCTLSLEDAAGERLFDLEKMLHDVSNDANNLCQLIEKLPASSLQTRISIAASELASKVAAQLQLAGDGVPATFKDGYEPKDTGVKMPPPNAAPKA